MQRLRMEYCSWENGMYLFNDNIVSHNLDYFNFVPSSGSFECSARSRFCREIQGVGARSYDPEFVDHVREGLRPSPKFPLSASEICIT